MLRIAAGALLVAFAVVALAHSLGASTAGLTAWLPPCPFRAATGWPCPGCGMGRALLLLAQLEWRAALALHPAAPLLLGAVAGLALRPRVGATARRHPALVGAALVALLALWAIRLSSGAAV